LNESLLEILDSDDSLSLYIHIPFCRSKCSYCQFYSVTRDKEDEKLYFNKLIEELNLVINKRKAPFETLFIGGGDPFLLKTEYLEKILELAGSLGKIKEVTIESNPNSLTSDYNRLITKGLTRISIGLQSMNKNHLKTLGRNVTVEENKKVLDLIKDERNIDFNLDLITSIPNQSLNDTLDDIDLIVDKLNVSHISLYNLTVEEGTLLAKRVNEGVIKILDDEEQADLLLGCWNHLEKRGYHQYEVSNFALNKAKRALHNERTWDCKSYLGLGCGAASTLTFKNITYRVSGKSDLKQYLGEKPFSVYQIEALDKFTLIEESLILGLRTADGIDKNRWNSRFDLDFDLLFGSVLNPLVDKSKFLFKETKEKLILSKEGLLVSDALIVKMISSLGSYK